MGSIAVIALMDTHAILWAVEDDPRLGSNCRGVIESSGEGELAISDISLLEIAMLIKKGRITVKRSASGFLGDVSSAFRTLSIDAYVAAEAVELDLPQGDPFDRVIVATARRHSLRLLTNDMQITRSRLVETVW